MGTHFWLRAVFCFGMFSALLQAANIPVLNLSLSADLPSDGVQRIEVTNQTGPTNGCAAYYTVCDALTITDWTVTVSYSSSYYNGSGPTLATPYVLRWQSAADDITPQSPRDLDFDLCGTSPVSSCGTATTTISSVQFQGSLDRSSFTLYDSGSGGPGPTFFANPSFSVTFAPTSGFPADYYESQDAFVTDQLSAVPEPGLLLPAICCLVLAVRKRTARHQ